MYSRLLESVVTFPHFDDVKRESVRTDGCLFFTNGNAASPRCSPTHATVAWSAIGSGNVPTNPAHRSCSR